MTIVKSEVGEASLVSKATEVSAGPESSCGVKGGESYAPWSVESACTHTRVLQFLTSSQPPCSLTTSRTAPRLNSRTRVVPMIGALYPKVKKSMTVAWNRGGVASQVLATVCASSVSIA